MQAYKTIQLLVLLALASTCCSQSIIKLPMYKLSANFASDPASASNQLGVIRVYWNNEVVFTMRGTTTASVYYWFYLNPRVGTNTLAFVLDNSIGVPAYLDNITFSQYNPGIRFGQNIIANGDFQSNGGWMEPNINVNNFNDLKTKAIKLDGTSSVITQIFTFDKDYFLKSSPSNPCGANQAYYVTFDYFARIAQPLKTAVASLDKNGNSVNITCDSYDRRIFFDFVCAKPASKNILSFTTVNRISSTFMIDNVALIKVGTFENSLGGNKGGNFQLLLNFCGNYNKKNQPATWAWKGALSLVAGCVVNRIETSNVLQIGKDKFWLQF